MTLLTFIAHIWDVFVFIGILAMLLVCVRIASGD